MEVVWANNMTGLYEIRVYPSKVGDGAKALRESMRAEQFDGAVASSTQLALDLIAEAELCGSGWSNMRVNTVHLTLRPMVSARAGSYLATPPG